MRGVLISFYTNATIIVTKSYDNDQLGKKYISSNTEVKEITKVQSEHCQENTHGVWTSINGFILYVAIWYWPFYETVKRAQMASEKRWRLVLPLKFQKGLK